METVLDSFSQPIISAFGWTLIHAVWQGTLFALIAFAGFYLLKSKSASLRYNFGIALLGIQVLSSAATFTYYHLHLSAVTAAGLKPLTGLVANVSKATYHPSVTAKVILWLNLHLNELVFCWLIGAVILMLRFAGGWIYTQRLRSNAQMVTDKQWKARFGILIAKLDITQSVEFKETAQILTPIVIGAIRPVVLVPIGLLTGLSISQTEAILAHELAHIRRNDYLINILQSFVDVVFFFHPALWWLSERIRTEREHCCDDIAIAACNDKFSFAEALLKVAEWQQAPRLAMAFASRKPLLLQRVRRVLGVNPKTEGLRSNRALSLVFISLLIGFSMYAVAQQNASKPAKDAKKQETKTVKVKAVPAEAIKVQNVNVHVDVVPEVAIEPLPEVEVTHALALAVFPDDSLNRKMLEHHKKMEALQTEMEPLLRQMEEVNLQMEKHNFEMERFEREIEKIEWKKNKVVDARQKLVEKRSALLNPNSKSGQARPTDSDLEKQIADIETQIKSFEQQIMEFNAQKASARKEATAYQDNESFLKLKKEIDTIHDKLDDVQTRLSQEASEVEKYYPTRPVQVQRGRVAKAPRASRSPATLPPPPPPVPAKTPKAELVPPPPPPLPPAKK
jgi:bla regulator protein BlaR1